MKLDLSIRDIELLLAIMYEYDGRDRESAMRNGFAAEDLVLMDKLEAALKRVEFFGEDATTLPASDLYH